MGCAHGRPPPGPTLLGSKAGVQAKQNWEAELEKVGRGLKEKLKDWAPGMISPVFEGFLGIKPCKNPTTHYNSLVLVRFLIG